MSPSPLKHFINVWTLGNYPNGNSQGEWTSEQKLAAIKEAGFDDCQCGFSEELRELAPRHGLAYLDAFDADETNYAARLKAFAPIRPPQINVQLLNHDTDPSEAAHPWVDVVKAVADLGLEVDLEIHRDPCTETPEKTRRIAELYQQQTGQPLRFNFDLSHFAVVRHLCPPYAPRLPDHPELFQLSRQIPVTDGQGGTSPWVKPWFEFVEAAFVCWQQGNAPDTTLWVCPELGTMGSGYWLEPFPDPWKDAIVVRREFDRLWQSVSAPAAA